VAATTDPATLPELTTWYLAANLPRPESPQAIDAPIPAADLAEIVRIYGLRHWIEQGYKQIKNQLGWADFMVRSDEAIRRHWYLICCAFSFIWQSWFNNQTQAGPPDVEVKQTVPAEAVSAEVDIEGDSPVAEPAMGWGENRQQGGKAAYEGAITNPRFVAGGTTLGQRMAVSLVHYFALLAGVVERAPAAGTASATRLGWQRSPNQPISPMLTKYH